MHACITWIPWWRHQMEVFSTLLAICAGNSPVPSEFPTQRPVTQSFDVCFDLRPNKRLSKQSWGWWFETQWRPLWRHRNDQDKIATKQIATRRCVHFLRWSTPISKRYGYKNNTNTHPIQTSSVVISGTPVTQEDSMKCSRCPWETGGHTYDVYIQ